MSCDPFDKKPAAFAPTVPPSAPPTPPPPPAAFQPGLTPPPITAPPAAPKPHKASGGGSWAVVAVIAAVGRAIYYATQTHSPTPLPPHPVVSSYPMQQPVMRPMIPGATGRGLPSSPSFRAEAARAESERILRDMQEQTRQLQERARQTQERMHVSRPALPNIGRPSVGRPPVYSGEYARPMQNPYGGQTY